MPHSPVDHEHALVPIEPPPVETERRAVDSLNWSEIAFELELDAMARQIALNCIVQSYQSPLLRLAFLPELEVILKPEMEQQIKRAIERKLGVSLNLEFISSPSLDFETPHQADVRRQEEERQQRIREIRQDAQVQQLKAAFGADLIEDSVQKQR